MLVVEDMQEGVGRWRKDGVGGTKALPTVRTRKRTTVLIACIVVMGNMGCVHKVKMVSTFLWWGYTYTKTYRYRYRYTCTRVQGSSTLLSRVHKGWRSWQPHYVYNFNLSIFAFFSKSRRNEYITAFEVTDFIRVCCFETFGAHFFIPFVERFQFKTVPKSTGTWTAPVPVPTTVMWSEMCVNMKKTQPNSSDSNSCLFLNLQSLEHNRMCWVRDCCSYLQYSARPT